MDTKKIEKLLNTDHPLQPSKTSPASTHHDDVVNGNLPPSSPRHYGDCFVGGLIIGGEAGILFSQDNYDRHTVETVRVTVTIKFLFMKESKSVVKTKEQKIARSSFKIAMFDTKANQFGVLQPGMENIAAAERGLGAIEGLGVKIEEKLKGVLEGSREVVQRVARL